MIRYLTRFFVYTITILLATLLSEWLVSLIQTEKTYKYVAVRMIVVLFIFVPIVSFLEKYIKAVSNKYVKESKNSFKNRYLGLFIGYFIILMIIFGFFAKIFINRNLLEDLASWISQSI